MSSRIIMVLAWIYRNIFALCVVLQVGSLWQSTGGGSRRVRGARGNTRDRGGEVERQADLVAGVHQPRRETRRLRPRRSAA